MIFLTGLYFWLNAFFCSLYGGKFEVFLSLCFSCRSGTWLRGQPASNPSVWAGFFFSGRLRTVWFRRDHPTSSTTATQISTHRLPRQIQSEQQHRHLGKLGASILGTLPWYKPTIHFKQRRFSPFSCLTDHTTLGLVSFDLAKIDENWKSWVISWI